jgi:hypothetical protein
MAFSVSLTICSFGCVAFFLALLLCPIEAAPLPLLPPIVFFLIKKKNGKVNLNSVSTRLQKKVDD